MSEQVGIDYALTVSVEDAATQIRQLERLIFRTISLLNRMGLPEDLQKGLITIQRAISAIRMLRISLTMLQTAVGPVGWATAIIGLTIGMAEMGELTVDVASQAKQGYRPVI